MMMAMSSGKAKIAALTGAVITTPTLLDMSLAMSKT
jgi:hypothetical protein